MQVRVFLLEFGLVIISFDPYASQSAQLLTPRFPPRVVGLTHRVERDLTV